MRKTLPLVLGLVLAAGLAAGPASAADTGASSAPAASTPAPAGTIGGQYGWLGDQNTQKLMTRENRDPITGYPCYFEVPVSVTKKA